MIFRRRQGSNPMTSDMISRACPVTREQTLRPRSCGFGTIAFHAKTGAGDQEWREVIREKSGTDGGKQKEKRKKHRQCNMFERLYCLPGKEEVMVPNPIISFKHRLQHKQAKLKTKLR